ncbi:MAG: phosphopyruvate hydratase [Candidatus Magasanikbacteria bacterium]|nr:phosphopyruvate hydratase [Candidatus Magasanikbacteria bacterium]
MKIVKIEAREILDSRGNPTVSAKVFLSSGAIGAAAVPSGASIGSHEAWELRDGGKRYGGKGVLKAVKNVNEAITQAIAGKEFESVAKLDKVMLKLDGTKNKSRLGANAILSVSLAAARAGATETNLPLYQYLARSYNFSASFKMPGPLMNVLNGGAHADSGLSVQEFMLAPQSKKMTDCVRIGAEVFYALKSLLKKNKQAVSVGDEGGFAPRLVNSEEALKFLIKAIAIAGYRPGQDVFLALDAAASEFFAAGQYNLDGKKLSAADLGKIYFFWLKKYPLIYLEDPFAEDDWGAWKEFKAELKNRKAEALLVGDDLFVTNAERLQKGIKERAANAILIKINQIGTLSETMAAIKLAQKNGFKVIISHRSGETADTFIADLAVAVGADYIKAGSLSRSERVEKYNRLMEIEKEL